MSKESELFLKTMLGFLPSTISDYEESVNHYGEVLETVIIEDIFMPEIIKLIKNGENIKLLENIFQYFEEVSNSTDSRLVDNFSVTVLEILGSYEELLEIAQKYMGPKTTQLLIETMESMWLVFKNQARKG